MSRNSYAKTYGRKVGANTIQPASIQFDKLFCENSNRPSAAKSAGTIGKWGITSFTSIRSSNFSLISKFFKIFSLNNFKDYVSNFKMCKIYKILLL